jgi:excisionase family DNA binding protein
MGRMLTAIEAAKVSGLSEKTIRLWLRDKKLPATKVGKTWQIDIEDLESVLGRSLEEMDTIVLTERADRFIDPLRGTVARRALLVGMSNYTRLPPLHSVVGDITELNKLLQRNDDKSPNYSCQALTSKGAHKITRQTLLEKCASIFRYEGDLLLYFSGYGSLHTLFTEETRDVSQGIALNEIIAMANQSPAQEIFIILDLYSNSTLDRQIHSLSPRNNASCFIVLKCRRNSERA